MLRAVIFDLDGTLYESRRFPLRLILSDPLHISFLASERKIRRQLRERHFDSVQEYYDTLFTLMGKGSARRARKCREWFLHSYMPAQIRIIREVFGPREGAKQLLRSLRAKGYKLALLTDYGCAEEKLSACALSASDFDAVWESPALGGLKPRAEVFLGACAALGVQPGEALMVGDKADTDGGALAAGLSFIRIAGGEKSRESSSPAQVSPGPRFARPILSSHSTLLWSEFLRYCDSLPALSALKVPINF